MSRKKNKSAAAVPPTSDTVSAPVPPAAKSKRDLFLIGLLLIAAAIRLIHLGKAELWQDELGFLIYAQTRLSLGEVCRTSWSLILSIGQMPLSFIVFNICYRIMEIFTGTVGPFTPALARLPSVVFGVAAVWSSYRLALRVLNVTSARIIAVMMTVFFFPVYYSREAYVYAQLLLLTPIALQAAVDIVFGGVKTGRTYLLYFLTLTAILYSHLGALMVVVALALCIAWTWITCLRRGDKPAAKAAFNAGLITAAALLAASPYILRFVLYNKAHTGGSAYSLLVILNDVVAKLFLGEQLWANICSWAALAAGIVSLSLPGPRPHERRLLAAVTVIGLLAITWATHRSQYLSARYFSPVAPFVLVVMGQGVCQVGLWIAKLLRLPETKHAYACAVIAALPIGVHAFIYTPALLQVTQKSTPFGAVARWINENLEPGSPYLLESAYEVRWVGQSFPTPNNQPAAPYVHGNHPSELVRLHEKQIAFMERFPEAPFIESAHHNWDTAEGLWDWPHKHFRQHILVGDPESTKRLIRMGIYPGLPHEKTSEYSYRVDIYYNSREDRIAVARDAGRSVIPDYAGWQLSGQQISQQETLYFRVQRGMGGELRLLNVGDAPASGSLKLSLAVPDQATSIQIRRGDNVLHRGQMPAGRFVDINVAVSDLPPGESTIQWQRGPGDGLILMDAVWQ